MNQAAGIEQGFTLSARPDRKQGAGEDKPLRLVVSVTGDLRASAAGDGQSVELRKGGEGVASYSKLMAQDADGKQLAARMEASADGREIALVVEDAGARYPIVIDPIVATLEQKLDALSFRQAGAEFGDAVAIDGNTAIVGAWREDSNSYVDAGAIYIFSRSGSTWSLATGGQAADPTRNAATAWQ